jgi:RNA polymerase sigma factor (TIGR02999 family)
MDSRASAPASDTPQPHDHHARLLEPFQGGSSALDGYVPVAYDELRRIAHQALRHERPGHTLTTTALVNEAYLRLVDQTQGEWSDRAHFLAVASQMMRRILVDYARRHRAGKRYGARDAVSLDDAAVVDIATLADERAELLVALDDALTRLAEIEPRLAQVVECRFFGGLTEEETAAALGVTDRTVRRDWVKAKGWLYQVLSP